MRKAILVFLLLALVCSTSAEQTTRESLSCELAKSTREQVRELISTIRNAPADGATKRAAVLGIMDMQDKAKYEALAEALDDSDNAPLARIAIAQILIHLTVVEKDMDAVPALIHALDKESCLYAFMVLAHLKERAVDALVHALDENSGTVSKHAGWLLGAVGAPAVPPLIEALKNDEPHARKYAAFALGEIEDREAVPGLIELLEDESADVRKFAAVALGKITSLDFGNPYEDTSAVVAKWLRWWKDTGERESGGKEN